MLVSCIPGGNAQRWGIVYGKDTAAEQWLCSSIALLMLTRFLCPFSHIVVPWPSPKKTIGVQVDGVLLFPL